MVVAVRNTLSEVYPATADSVTHARRWAADFAAWSGADSETVEAVKLAVSEAVTNVVLHAYGNAPGELQLTLAVAEHELWALVADNGRGHQSAPLKPGLGWGLALIADACETFVITERSGGGTELRMRFPLPRTR
jgi:anti-sigma regulatory factor (Ser/Thr protein kinase)